MASVEHVQSERQEAGSRNRGPSPGGYSPEAAQGLPLRSPQVAIQEPGASRQRCAGGLRRTAQQRGRHLLGVGCTSTPPILKSLEREELNPLIRLRSFPRGPIDKAC